MDGGIGLAPGGGTCLGDEDSGLFYQVLKILVQIDGTGFAVSILPALKLS